MTTQTTIYKVTKADVIYRKEVHRHPPGQLPPRTEHQIIIRATDKNGVRHNLVLNSGPNPVKLEFTPDSE